MHKASLGCSFPDVVRDSSETIVRNDANYIAQPECLFVSQSNYWCIHMHNNMLFLARAITQIECYQKLQQLLIRTAILIGQIVLGHISNRNSR